MFYYVLGNGNKVIKSISIAEGEDPYQLGAIPDPREFNVGDTWCPDEVESEPELD